MPQVVDAKLPELALLEDPREDVADVPLLERRALQRDKHPRRQGLTLLDPSLPLQPAPGEQRLEQLPDMSTRRRWCDFGEVRTPRTRFR